MTKQNSDSDPTEEIEKVEPTQETKAPQPEAKPQTVEALDKSKTAFGVVSQTVMASVVVAILFILGLAGFIAYGSGVVSTTLDPRLLVVPFTAGIALKGVIDAAANTNAGNVKTKSP